MGSVQNPFSGVALKSPSIFDTPLGAKHTRGNESNEQPRLSRDALPLRTTHVDSIYGNALKFPAGLDHLKYFENNPHPEIITDESLAFAEPFLKKDLNTPLASKLIQF